MGFHRSLPKRNNKGVQEGETFFLINHRYHLNRTFRYPRRKHHNSREVANPLVPNNSMKALRHPCLLIEVRNVKLVVLMVSCLVWDLQGWEAEWPCHQQLPLEPWVLLACRGPFLETV